MDPQNSEYKDAVDSVLLVGTQLSGMREWEVNDYLDELSHLTQTAGGHVKGRFICKREKPHPGLYIGSGKAEEIAQRVQEERVTTVIFDDDLSAVQGRNLERIIKVKVLDRTQLILDIFAQHARTREGCLQIELAQMQYILPRLRRMWTHLERQRGGIGLRGPGEQQIEVDRRRVEERIVRLKKELEHVRRRRAEQRRGRKRHGWAVLSLIGYTNAGKSTLLNRLTEADVLAYDKLFATLDPTTRQLDLPNHPPILITDTVGFIRKLPHGVVESFKATLEEIVESDVLVHVIDASHPHVENQIEAVFNVLHEIGAADKQMLAVFNKMDVPKARQHIKRLAKRFDHYACVSALNGTGLDECKALIADSLRDRMQVVHLRVPLREAKVLALLKSTATLLEEKYDHETAFLVAAIPVNLTGVIKPYRVNNEEDKAVPGAS